MHRSLSFRVKGFFVLAGWLLAFASGCASTPDAQSYPPDELMAKGKKSLESDSLEDAVSLFQKVLEDYPDSKERVAALIYLAHAHFKAGDYEEARFNYNKFIELYPAHKHVDQAHYFKAMSDFKMMDISSKDQTHTHEALQEFEYLIKNFPQSPYRSKAENGKKECQYKLAKNYFDVGKFYFRTGSYQSAIIRFKKFMERYPGESFTEEAIFLLGESYFQEQNYEEAKGFYEKLLAQYPRSAFTKEARLRLTTIR